VEVTFTCIKDERLHRVDYALVRKPSEPFVSFWVDLQDSLSFSIVSHPLGHFEGVVNLVKFPGFMAS
jgi:hypothetical protein